MKRSLLVVGIMFLILLGGITLLRRPAGSDDASSSRAGTERGNRIKRFWEDYNRGEKLRLEGDYDRAATAYRKALEIDPDHQDSLFYLAVCLQESGMYSEAESRLRRVIELYPDNNRAYTQLGTLLATRAPGAEPDLEAASEAFVRSQKINREHSGPFVQQGLLELDRGNIGKAGELFAVAAGGGAPEALFLVGLADYLDGDYRAAVGGLVRVLDANRREKAISGRGMASEGDLHRAGGARGLNAFERAGVKALFFLYWSANRLGGYPETVPESFRLHPPADLGGQSRFSAMTLPRAGSGRGLWIDYDHDGRSDLLVTGRQGTRLYRNAGGGWEEATGAAGLPAEATFWDACPLDLDRNGWEDLYLIGDGYTGRGNNRLYLNDRGRFHEVTREWGLTGTRATAAALGADFNGDGKVDLVEAGNRTEETRSVRLFINQGTRYVESAAELGLSYPAHAVDVAVADYDGDGLLDIFILGWKRPGRLFRNRSTRFEDVTSSSGLDGVGGNGFSALFFDFNRDSRPDLLVTAHAELELSLRRILDRESTCEEQTPRLFLNQAKGRFAEVTASVGLNRCFGTMQAVSADFDSDGWPDLLVAQGGLEATHLEPALILRNRRGGAFEEWAYLPSFEEPEDSLGAAVADINGDHQPDVFLSNFGVLINRDR